jgi:hypothetical protein
MLSDLIDVHNKENNKSIHPFNCNHADCVEARKSLFPNESELPFGYYYVLLLLLLLVFITILVITYYNCYYFY